MPYFESCCLVRQNPCRARSGVHQDGQNVAGSPCRASALAQPQAAKGRETPRGEMISMECLVIESGQNLNHQEIHMFFVNSRGSLFRGDRKSPISR